MCKQTHNSDPRKKKKKTAELVYEEMTADTSFGESYIQVQKVQRSLNKRNLKRATLAHIVIKMSEFKDEIFKIYLFQLEDNCSQLQYYRDGFCHIST